MCRTLRLAVLTTLLATLTSITAETPETTRYETVHNSNAAILQRLGLVPVRIPDGHHKKRLSGPEPSDSMDHPLGSKSRIHEPYSRRHGNRDSHVYVVKLPPSQPYYTLTKPHKSSNHLHKEGEQSLRINDDRNAQVGFHSNGKPGKIYHWNLPLVKKVNERKKLHAQSKIEQMRKRLEEEMNDEQSENRGNHDQRSNEKTKTIPSDGTRKETTLGEPQKSTKNDQTSTKVHHHRATANSLSHDEKPVKHTRNNDKRLNYSRINALGKHGRPKDNTKEEQETSVEDGEKTAGKNNKKSYRLEDSNVYRLEAWNNNNNHHNSNERHKNDRLAVWSLSNELHASGNPQNSMRPKKHWKKAAMSYYAPIDSRTNRIELHAATNIQKNFPGNGKPKAFYVMEKSRQPVYYHPLLP